MDITPKYILMCEKAKKIQEEWKPEPGDWVHHPYRNTTRVYIGPAVINSCDCVSCKKVWLPRQDQLQEMLGILCDEYEYYIRKLLDFIFDLSFTKMSMEQLWFAFVMHEKYQKQWDEEKGEWTADNEKTTAKSN